MIELEFIKAYICCTNLHSGSVSSANELLKEMPKKVFDLFH